MTEIPQELSEKDIALRLLQAGAVSISDVDGGEKPFLYSSGNLGPGYVMVKGMVSRDDVFPTLAEQSALRLISREAQFDFIAANATGGMVPGWEIKKQYERFTGRKVPYVYVRNTRKLGGHQEYVTGLEGNPFIPQGSVPLIYEELVNFAETTSNSKVILAELGHMATHAGCILTYDNPEANQRLAQEGLTLVYVIKLPTVLEVAEECGIFTPRAIEGYRSFLANPQKWQTDRGLKRLELPKN